MLSSFNNYSDVRRALTPSIYFWFLSLSIIALPVSISIFSMLFVSIITHNSSFYPTPLEPDQLSKLLVGIAVRPATIDAVCWVVVCESKNTDFTL